MGMDFRMVHAKPVDECTVFILDYQAAKDIFERFEDSETDKFMKDAKEKYEIILKKTKNSGRKNTVFNRQAMQAKKDDNSDDDISENDIRNANTKDFSTQTTDLSTADIERLLKIERKYKDLDRKNRKGGSKRNKHEKSNGDDSFDL